MTGGAASPRMPGLTGDHRLKSAGRSAGLLSLRKAVVRLRWKVDEVGRSVRNRT